MVSLTQRDEFIIGVERDSELRPLRAFVFGERVSESLPGTTTRSRLFEALRRNDSHGFGDVISDLERRKLSPDSDWIGDDCVTFFLVLGTLKFSMGENLVDKLLQARGKTTNPQAQRVNQAFEAIRRREFAMEGEYAFIKAAYRVISESWKPSDPDCAQLYKQLTKPGFVEQLDPFLRLLAIRTFDLVIESRTASLDPGTWPQVFQKLQDEGAKLSLSQFFRLLKHLRIGVVIAIILALPAIFGAGSAWSWWRSKPSKPNRVALSGPLLLLSRGSELTNSWTLAMARYLEEAGSRSTNLVSRTVVAVTEPFAHPTKEFTANGTLAGATELGAFAFLMHPIGVFTSSIPVQVTCASNTFAASVPPGEPGDWVQFVVRGLVRGTNTALDPQGIPLVVTASQ